MKHVPVAPFKDRVSEYIAETERGEEVIITRHGKPAVKMTAIDQDADRRERSKAAFARMAELREELRAQGVHVSVDEIIAWKNEGQR
jgi:prevent-host-death family protein